MPAAGERCFPRERGVRAACTLPLGTVVSQPPSLDDAFHAELAPSRLAPNVNAQGTIYLVDDDEALRRATQRLLVDCGFRVLAFVSADEFLRVFEAGSPGCLLLDLRMNGLSGLELQQLLLERGSPPPIVFITGHADASTRAQALAKGAIAFLEKPAREDTLIDALQRALRSGASE